MNYKAERWEKKRAIILRRDKYTCQWCKRFGKLKQAEMVHHIFPVEVYPEYAFCNWNLISLCNKCHNTMHERDSHEMTSNGLNLQRRYEKERKRHDSEASPTSRSDFGTAWGPAWGSLSK